MESVPSSETQMPTTLEVFAQFRSELDEQQDRRERIIKASRDITALSKKIIFALHRVKFLDCPLTDQARRDIKPHNDKIAALFSSIVPDIQQSNYWRWHGQLTSGIQEFIEAISFQHFLETQTLLDYQTAQARMPSGVQLTQDDYLLGLCDLTGEMMRYAITSMATNGFLAQSSSGGSSSSSKGTILTNLRQIRIAYESLDITSGHGDASPLKSELRKKLEVMQTSVEKVESAAYSMAIRGQERPPGWTPDTGSSVAMDGIKVA